MRRASSCRWASSAATTLQCVRSATRLLPVSSASVYLVRSQTHDPAPPPLDYIPVSGGIFKDCLIHDIDVVRYVTGQEVVCVRAAGAVIGFPEIGALGDVDSATVVLELSGGTLGQLSALRHDPVGYDVRLEVFGSRTASPPGGATGRRFDRQSPALPLPTIRSRRCSTALRPHTAPNWRRSSGSSRVTSRLPRRHMTPTRTFVWLRPATSRWPRAAPCSWRKSSERPAGPHRRCADHLGRRRLARVGPPHGSRSCHGGDDRLRSLGDRAGPGRLPASRSRRAE